MNKYIKLAEDNLKLILEDSKELISVPSYFDPETVTTERPFGDRPYNGLVKMSELIKKYGFNVKNINNYVLEVDFGNFDSNEMFASLSHIDTVPPANNWETDPFEMIIKDNAAFGLGALDDKIPSLLVLHAIRVLRDDLKINFKKKFRLIFGSDEESGFRDLDYYFDVYKAEQPTFGFSPDARFPAIVFEKGIISFKLISKLDSFTKSDNNVIKISVNGADNQIPDNCHVEINSNNINNLVSTLKNIDNNDYEIINETNETLIINFKGIAGHGSEPNSGKSAIHIAFDFLNTIKFDNRFETFKNQFTNYFHNDLSLEKINLDSSHEFYGKSTNNIGLLEYNHQESYIISNMRYLDEFDFNSFVSIVTDRLKDDYIVSVYKSNDKHSIDTNNEYFIELQNAYESILDEKPTVQASAGGTYAKKLKYGLAFGPSFKTMQETKIHNGNERFDLDDMKKAFAIYIKAFENLNNK